MADGSVPTSGMAELAAEIELVAGRVEEVSEVVTLPLPAMISGSLSSSSVAIAALRNTSAQKLEY